MSQGEELRGPAIRFDSTIPEEIRKQFDFTEDLYCQMCGISHGELDDYTGRIAEFHAGWLPNNGLSFRSSHPEVRILCSTCNQGAKNITPEKPTTIWLLSQVRRAGLHEQKAVFEWLSNKFAK